MELFANVIGEKGEPFLILHGFLGMGDNWKTLGKDFAEQGYQVHLVDLRNHGRSPHTEEFSYQIMAQDIAEYCKQNNLENIILLGHSMGGKVAMKFAVENPEFLKDLIIVDIAPKYYAPHHQTILEGLSALQDANLDSRSKADDLLKEYIKEWGVRQFLLKNLYWKTKDELAFRMNLEVLKDKVEVVGEALNEGEIYEEKTLFIAGENSNYIKEEDSDLLKTHFPKSNLVKIKGAGHWVHAEKAEEFYTAVMGFLA